MATGVEAMVHTRTRKNVILAAFVALALFVNVVCTQVGYANSTYGWKDVDNSFWGYDTLLWAQGNGILDGYPDGTVRPNEKVTEAEFLAMLLRSLGDVKSASADKHWYDKYYRFAQTHNYPISGDPESKIDRTQVAEIIVGTQGLNYTGDNAIQYMLGKGLANGEEDATIKGYKGANLLTRAEGAQFVRNFLDKADSKTPLTRPTTPSDPNKLPPLPTTQQPAPSGDDQEAIRQDIENAVKSDGYTAINATDANDWVIKDSDGITVASYGDGRPTGGVQTITLYQGINKDFTPNNDNLKATVDMMQAVGINVSDDLADAIGKAITTTGRYATTTVESNSVKVSIVNINGEKALITVQ